MSVRGAIEKFRKTIFLPSIWIAGRECILDHEKQMDDSIGFLFSRDILGIKKEDWSNKINEIKDAVNAFSSLFNERVFNEEALTRLVDKDYVVVKKGLDYYLEKSRNQLINAVGEGDESKMAELDRRVRDLTILLQEINYSKKGEEPKKYLPPKYGPTKIQDLIRKFSILLLSTEKGLESGVTKENEGKVLEILGRVTNKTADFQGEVKGADKDSQALFEIGLDGMEPFRRAYLYVYLGNYLERIKKKIADSSLPADKKTWLTTGLEIHPETHKSRGIALQIDELFDRLLRLQGEYDEKIGKLTDSLEDLLKLAVDDRTEKTVKITKIEKIDKGLTFTFRTNKTGWNPAVKDTIEVTATDTNNNGEYIIKSIDGLTFTVDSDKKGRQGQDPAPRHAKAQLLSSSVKREIHMVIEQLQQKIEELRKQLNAHPG